MPTYLFLLGNTPPLSFAELQALMPDESLKLVSDQICSVELANDERARHIMDLSGGTVKVLKQLQLLTPPELEDLETTLTSQLLAHLEATGDDKVTFGLGEIGRDHLEPVASSTVKHGVIKAGYKARYVEGTRQGLSASILLHKEKVVELVVIQTADHVYLAKTVAIQDIDRWTVRDREKPYADSRKGMLPPKVARMMVNLALAHLPPVEPSSSKRIPLIYDPFCGTGTVLIEAILRDCHVVGSDLDVQSVAGTRRNLEWLLQNLEDIVIRAKTSVFHADVSNASPSQLVIDTQVDAIVTEPFLGKPKPFGPQVPNIIKGLTKLYLGAFKNWTRLLKDGGVVVMVFPIINAGNQSYTMETLIDKLAPLGYTTVLQPIIYSRAQAVTQRQLFVFKFNRTQQ